MSFLKILLPLLAASSAPLPCRSFAPSNPPKLPSRPPSNVGSSAQQQPHDVPRVAVARSARGDDGNERHDGEVGAFKVDEAPERRAGKVAGSAFVALALAFSVATAPPGGGEGASIASSYANAATPLPSVMISRGAILSPDEEVIKELEVETREAEREARIDEKRARVERSRERFFEYEAKMAEEQEARIEAEEFRAEAEYSYDREQAELLKALEKKAEREMKLAATPQEKAAKTREARVSFFLERGKRERLPCRSRARRSSSTAVVWFSPFIVLLILPNIRLANPFLNTRHESHTRQNMVNRQELLRKEKEIERKERRAERAEKIYLAEEKQEQIILRQKEDAALAVSVHDGAIVSYIFYDTRL